MEEFGEFLAIFKERRDLFLRYEQMTAELIRCDTEELERRVDERGDVITRIDALDVRLFYCCEDEDAGELYRAVLMRTCSESDLPEGLQPAYELSSEVRASVSRTVELEIQAGLRVRAEQEAILEKIKSANRGAGAQAVKFFAAGREAPFGSIPIGKA